MVSGERGNGQKCGEGSIPLGNTRFQNKAQAGREGPPRGLGGLPASRQGKEGWGTHRTCGREEEGREMSAP